MKSSQNTVISGLLGLVLGGGLVYLAYNFLSKEILMRFFPDNQAETIIFYSSVILAPISAIALHELGHLSAGLLQGFQLELYVVGFLGIKRKNNRVKVFFNTNLQYFGGVAASSPKQLLSDKELIDKYKIILLAGPLSSLIFFMIPFLLFYFLDTVFNPFWSLLSISSFGIFLATTLPTKTGIFFTDRKRFQRLNDKGEVGKIELAFLEVANQSLVEKTCKNLSLDKINIIKKDEDKIMQFWGYLFEFQYYKDNEQTDKMQDTIAILLEYQSFIPKAIWKSLEIE